MASSMNYKLLPQPREAFFKKHSSYGRLLLTILFQRELRTSDEIEAFLNPHYGQPRYDPFHFKEMKTVVERILAAAEKRERVLVFGDYDADGVTSSVVLIETLEKLYNRKSSRSDPRHEPKNEELIQVYLPHRDLEGYGLNMGAVEYIKRQEINLVITCDCGSTNTNELIALQNAKIDVIILDHHLVPKERPPVVGFINPKFKGESYPFPHLAACGVVFKVVQAIRAYCQKIRSKNKAVLDAGSKINEAFEKWLLDLVAIATVADVMPLKGENRVFVKWGLVVLNKSKRLGLQALLRSARIEKVGTYEIGYVIAPRINAASRLDHANVAFDLLRQRDRKLVMADALKLDKTNLQRQKITEKIVLEAKKSISDQIEKRSKVLIAYNLKKGAWPTGLIGLVAGKLASEYYRPAFIIGLSEHGLAGSGRSIQNFDISLLVKNSGYLFKKSGGHPSACGFTFKDEGPREKFVKEFIRSANSYAKKNLKDEDVVRYDDVCAELEFKDITIEFVNKTIKPLEPFGEENSEPVFLTRAATIISAKAMGSNGAHSKLHLKKDNQVLEAVSFRSENHVKKLEAGNLVDIIYSVSINIWNGRQTLQLILKGAELSHD